MTDPSPPLPTADDLEAIRARADAAERGPWTVCADGAADFYGEDSYDVEAADNYPVASGGPVESGGPHVGACSQADAKFIAHARTDVPLLLAALAAAVARAERWQERFMRVGKRAVAAETEVLRLKAERDEIEYGVNLHTGAKIQRVAGRSPGPWLPVSGDHKDGSE